MTALSPAATTKLARLLGMIGSIHDGEALNAARLANRLVAEAGSTWELVLCAGPLPPPPPPEWREPQNFPQAVAACLRSPIKWNAREREFIQDIAGRYSLSDKQKSWLCTLTQRAKAATLAQSDDEF